jgi:phage terminase large subunit-like protein
MQAVLEKPRPGRPPKVDPNKKPADMTDAEFLQVFNITKDDYKFLCEFNQYKLENGIEFYEPYPKQVEFHKSLAPFRLFAGGNRVGKSLASAAELVWYALGTHPHKKIDVPNEGWVISKDYNVQKEAIQKCILELLPKRAIKGEPSHVKSGILDTIYLKNGSIITFKSVDSGTSRFAGAAKRWIAFDEEPPKEVWNECMSRIGAGVPLDVWIAMTPIFEDGHGRRIGMTWTYKDLYMKRNSDPRIFAINVALDDNPYITPEQKIEQKKKYFGTEYDIRIKGEFKLISGSMVFDPEAVQFFHDNAIEPKARGMLNQNSSGRYDFKESPAGNLKIWKPPVQGRKYFIGSDVGLGVGQDPSCAEVFDNDLNQVAELHGQIPPDLLAKELIALGKYYLDAWIGIEANSFGIATINEIKKKYAKLYFNYKVDERSDIKTKRLGWWTDSKSKPIMISEFSKVLREKVCDIRSKELVEELMTYVIDDSNSANAEIGCNDDRVISAMIAYQVWKKFHLSGEMQAITQVYHPANAITGY